MMKCEHNIHIIVKHVEIRFKHAFEPDVKYNLRSLNYSIHHMSYVNPWNFWKFRTVMCKFEWVDSMLNLQEFEYKRTHRDHQVIFHFQ